MDMGRKSENIEGCRFGKLVAVRPTDKRKSGSVVWECKCDCGKTAYYSTIFLRSRAQSCGCIRKENYKKQAKDVTGSVFQRLTALEATDKRDSDGSVIWRWKCECGNITEKSLNSVSRGLTKSCGCMNRETGSKSYESLLKPNYVVGTNLNILRSTDERGYKNNSTGIRGVFFHSKENVYVAAISFQGARIYKRYKTLEEAIEARRRMKQIHEEFLQWWDSLSAEERQKACLEYEGEKDRRTALLKKRIRDLL